MAATRSRRNVFTLTFDHIASTVAVHEGSAVLIVTTNDVPGHRIVGVIGEVSGLTVRTRHVGAQIGASLKALVGGELAGLTRQLSETRAEAVERLIQEATAVGANAVVAMRFDSNELGGVYQEVLAYGTAVVIEPIVS